MNLLKMKKLYRHDKLNCTVSYRLLVIKVCSISAVGIRHAVFLSTFKANQSAGLAS